jgi:hypothetical protein
MAEKTQEVNGSDSGADVNTNSAKSRTPDRNQQTPEKMPTEHGGPKGLEPTRYGDWEKNGRCTDF